MIPNLKITGNISKADKIKEDYSNGINNIDFMNNVGFNPKAEGLNAIYNEAPVINGFKENTEVVEKGASLNLRSNVTITDDNNDNNLSFTVSPEQIDTNQLGIHKVTYTTTDSWNRTTTKIRTIEVVSKVKSNSIQVYNPNEDNSLLFKIDFDANNKKFIINGTITIIINKNHSQDGQTENDLQESKTGETPSTEDSLGESNEGKIFRIKIFDNNGK